MIFQMMSFQKSQCWDFIASLGKESYWGFWGILQTRATVNSMLAISSGFLGSSIFYQLETNGNPFRWRTPQLHFYGSALATVWKNLETFSKKRKDLSVIEKTRAKCSVSHNLSTWPNVIHLPENLWITIDWHFWKWDQCICNTSFCFLFLDFYWHPVEIHSNLFQGLIPIPFL